MNGFGSCAQNKRLTTSAETIERGNGHSLARCTAGKDALRRIVGAQDGEVQL